MGQKKQRPAATREHDHALAGRGLQYFAGATRTHLFVPVPVVRVVSGDVAAIALNKLQHARVSHLAIQLSQLGRHKPHTTCTTDAHTHHDKT